MNKNNYRKKNVCLITTNKTILSYIPDSMNIRFRVGHISAILEPGDVMSLNVKGTLTYCP